MAPEAAFFSGQGGDHGFVPEDAQRAFARIEMESGCFLPWFT